MTWALLLALLGGAAGACSQPMAQTPAATAVRIDDFKAVAGVWEGLLSGLAAASSRDDWVVMKIGEDGAYEFTSLRQIGAFHGSGRLKLADGRLLLEGPRGRATFTLYTEGNRRRLRGEAATEAGRPVTADLAPKR
jgi:hypothetical protein